MRGEQALSAEPQAFYDGFGSRLVGDYYHGNARIEAAIEFAIASIPADSRAVLDVGCGLGWSTQEFCRAFPGARVSGIDLSPKLLALAARLAREENADFKTADLTAESIEVEGNFDAIVMIDVYEHIPVAARARLHRFLDRALAPGGVLILTCPSRAHQDYLRRESPGGLQPVDEDVLREDAERLAGDVSAELVSFEEKTIWRQGDYNHMLIARHPGAARGAGGWQLQPARERQRRVREALQVRPSTGGVPLAWKRDGVRLLVVTRQLDDQLETFIGQHLSGLPCRVRVLHGDILCELDDGSRLVSNTRLAGLWRRLRHRLGLFDFQNLHSRRLAAWLREHGIQAVLAEYGVNAVRVMDACRAAGVPLIAHFHGFDAYRHDVLERLGDRYRRLFETASGVVGVSRHMCGQLVRLGAPAERIHHVPCMADGALFRPARAAGNPPVFLFVGRMVDKKAPLALLRAFASTRRQAAEARLTLVGDGPLLAQARTLAAELGIADAVQFTGRLAHAEVAAAMRRARCYVQHSVVPASGDSEGTPVSILEAQACGLPVVSTRHGGIPDVVLEGETGFLVDEGDTEGMAEHMLRLARQPELAGRLGAAGAARIAKHFGHDQTLGKLAGIIEAAVQEGAVHA